MKYELKEWEEFHKETLNYMRAVSLDYRKNLGQYFTPKSIRESLIEKLPKKDSPKILDPGCGTGEFLLTAKKYFKNPELYGWEIDNVLVKIAQKLVPEAEIKEVDALKRKDYGKYDFVIGNPPYYEFQPRKEIRKRFKEVIAGRVNIYSLFLYQGIKLLKKGGYLAFVVSSSMKNGAYFSKLRKFILKTCNIEHISILNSPELFPGALQSVMLLILKKGKNNGDYTFEKNGVLIFSEKAKYLQKIFEGKTTLHELGYKVKTGKLVWNQNKDLLTNKAKGNIPLIWAHNITKEGLKLNNKGKPQYVKIQNYSTGPAIAVNRVTGRPGAGKIKAAIIPPNMRFIGENHVNIIFPSKKQSRIEGTEKKLGLKEIAEQLNSQEKLQIIQCITGNTQISKNELEKLFPIDLG